MDENIKKIKVMRVVTNSSVVPWHLNNTLIRFASDPRFIIYVIGNNVSKFESIYPNIFFIDCKIERNPDLIQDLIATIQLLKIFKNIKPNIVHSIMPKASLLSALASFIAKVPNRVHTFTGQMWNLKKKPKQSYLYWIDRLVLKLNTLCLTDSPSQSDYLSTMGLSYSGNELPYLGIGSLSGVEISESKINFNKVADIKSSLNLEENDFIFTYLARKNEEKGAFKTLRAFNQFNKEKKAKLLFIGPDNSFGELNSLRSKEPDLFQSVIEIDMVENYFDYLKCSNVLVLPSIREGFGSIVIDAASIGVPTIGTNTVGLKDAIAKDETGILIDIATIDEISNAMDKFYFDHDFYQKTAKNCLLRTKENFDADQLQEELCDLYIKLLK